MPLLEHLLQRRWSPRDHWQAAVKPLIADDLVDRVGPLRRVLLAYVEPPPVGEFDERRARVPGAERVEHPLLEVGKHSVLVNEHNAQRALSPSRRTTDRNRRAAVGSQLAATPGAAHWARAARMRRVSGWAGPQTRSLTGSSAASWSNAAAGSPASAVKRARSHRALRVCGCSGPEIPS